MKDATKKKQEKRKTECDMDAFNLQQSKMQHTMAKTMFRAEEDLSKDQTDATIQKLKANED